MLDWLSDAARAVHISLGFLGLAAFWIPIFAKKGGPLHRKAGKVFVWSAYVVLGSAALALSARLSALALQGRTPFSQPEQFGFIIFLAYLTTVTFVVVRHGIVVQRNKRNHAAIRTGFNRALAWLAITASTVIVLYALFIPSDARILLLALSPIGFLSGHGILKFIAEEPASSKAWLFEHIGSMIGAGIAFHTAFFVFGATRMFDIGLTGWVAAIPWLAPSLIGIPASALWARHYRVKFGLSS